MEIITPDLPALLALGCLFLSITFYAMGRIPMDLVSWGLLIVLLVVFQLFPFIDPVTGVNKLDAGTLMQGFANSALITVVCLLIVGEGVSRTGALAIIAHWIQQLAGESWRLALAISLTVVALTSALLNNTPVVVIFIPILLSLAEKMDISPSKLMMPLSFASILGGTCTLIGTSTNLLVADYLDKAGLPPLGMFTFSVPGLILLAVGLVYLVWIAPGLLPERREPAKSRHSKRFVAQLQILPDSPVADRLLSELEEDLFKDVEILQVIRGHLVSFKPPFDEQTLKVADAVVVRGDVAQLKRLEWDSRSTLAPYLAGTGYQDPEKAKNDTLAELVIPTGSRFIGLSLAQILFRNRYGVVVIGLYHPQSRSARSKSNLGRGRITEELLQQGDILLIQGKADVIAELTQNPDVLLYWGVSDTVIHAPKAPLAAAILAGMVGLAALNLTSMVVLSASAAFLMVATGCLSLRFAMQAVSSSIVLLIAATLALGEALQVTGAAHWMAESLVVLSAGQDPWVVLALFGLLVTILTNVISNNATAVIMAPIAFGVAETLGVNPMPFLMAVVFGANAAFATPISYKTNLLVMSVGAYRFGDFLKAGLVLNILVWLLISLMIPMFWSF